MKKLIGNNLVSGLRFMEYRHNILPWRWLMPSAILFDFDENSTQTSFARVRLDWNVEDYQGVINTKDTTDVKIPGVTSSFNVPHGMVLSDMSQGLEFLMQQTVEERDEMIRRFKGTFKEEEYVDAYKDFAMNDGQGNQVKRRGLEMDLMIHDSPHTKNDREVLFPIKPENQLAESEGSCEADQRIYGGAAKMKIASWNGQGLCAPLTKARLKELCGKVSPDILLLVETMNKCDVVRDVCVSLGFDNVCNVSPYGRGGGLAMFWKKNVIINKLFQDVYVEYNGMNFYFSCLYGHPVSQNRHELWERLERTSITRQGPWMLVGDFNEILSNDEKNGGSDTDDKSFQEFSNMVNTCNISDLRYKGNRFSWVGERGIHTVKCCVDRVMINDEWLALFPASETEFLPLYGSDHRPTLTTIAYSDGKRKRNFRFDKRLLNISDFKNYVYSGWKARNLRQNYTIIDQIRECRKSMAYCRRKKNLNASKQIEELKADLDISMSSSGLIRRSIPSLRRELALAYRNEEIYWKLKSRNNWLAKGDRNTQFFHACTKTRYSKNRIHAIQDTNGNFFRGDKEIGEHAEAYFKNTYKSNNNPILNSNFDGFIPTVTEEINTNITEKLSDLEIYNVVCNIGADKAPGLDGLTARFYQECWDVVGNDVIKEVNHFFLTSNMRQGVNHTTFV